MISPNGVHAAENRNRKVGAAAEAMSFNNARFEMMEHVDGASCEI